MLNTPPGLPASALVEATNYLNARFKGKTLSEARSEASEALARDRAALDQAAATLIEGGLVEWSGEDPMAGRSLIVRGRANLLQDSRAAADLERARRLFDDLEKTRDVIQVLDLAKAGESVRIFIGSETRFFLSRGRA